MKYKNIIIIKYNKNIIIEYKYIKYMINKIK